MDGDILAALLAIAVGFVGFAFGMAIQWGIQKATIAKLEEEIQRLDRTIDNFQAAINSLHREYVSHRQFEMVTNELKDAFRFMERDIKEILKHLQK